MSFEDKLQSLFLEKARHERDAAKLELHAAKEKALREELTREMAFDVYVSELGAESASAALKRIEERRAAELEAEERRRLEETAALVETLVGPKPSDEPKAES